MKKIYLISFIAFNVLLRQISEAQVVITLQPDSAIGKDALIQMRNSDATLANANLGGFQSFESVAWTWNSDPGLIRSLLQFDLTAIPAVAIVTDARLSLYNNPTSPECNGEHSSLTGSNASVLQQITSAWDEFTVTWNNQPATTAVNEINLVQSSSIHEDYLDIDVTPMIAGMIANPATNFGFMIKLDTEAYFRGMIFASSDHIDSTLHPKLKVTYEMESVNEITDNSLLDLYPNPSSGQSFIRCHTSLTDFNTLKIENALGQIILQENIAAVSVNGKKINLSNQPKGIYFVTITGNTKRCVKKLVIE